MAVATINRFRTLPGPLDGHVVELHLSDPLTREPWRHVSVVEPVAAARVAGRGAADARSTAAIAPPVSTT